MPLPPRRRARRPAVVFAAPPAMRVPRPAAWWIIPVIVLVGVAVGGTLWWLLADPALTTPAPGPSGPAGAGTARGEILRTALAAGAGVGAAVTLMLAFRRQRHQEIATAHATHDATERRVTELYTKAAEQLGSDKAAVRLAGLYALERLAQDNPGHRQTIVNVICSYLRMPYTPPEPAPAPDPEGDRTAALRAARRRYQAARAGVTPPAEAAPRQQSDDREGELQVRLTAQRILSLHLRDDRPADQRSTLPAAPAFWEGMSLDLTGATLLDFDLVRGHVTEAVFDKTTFTGNAVFDDTTFTGDAQFGGATFHRDARFDKATFTGDAGFNGTTFTGDAQLDGAVVDDPAADHVWPKGWRLETTPEGAGRLVREETDGDPVQGA
ncbi:pentapeptide repeat-containing protein [Streptosporangium sp. CA-135522]|uniref:pentapeptide repeat-containing protein n=1 Tax=Streptosporangium sp. CA-135522 TaxID=3240072 RepID=UPI003D92021A